jgi:DNA-binding response OmpR family regulator
MPDVKRVILCIDDDPDILSVLQIMLEAEGYGFAGAATAEEGLRAYAKVHPDLIIVDMMMEEVDAGAGLVKELQRLGNQAPVFLLSSVGDNLTTTIDYSSLGLAGVLQKPLAKKQLLSLVKSRLP